MYYYYNGELYHHGVEGQKWGTRNAAWYPIDAYKKHLRKNGNKGTLGIQATNVSEGNAKIGSAIGGVAGGLLATYLPVPGASVAGTIIGSTIGGTFAAYVSNFISNVQSKKVDELVFEVNNNKETKKLVQEIEKRYEGDSKSQTNKKSENSVNEPAPSDNKIKKEETNDEKSNTENQLGTQSPPENKKLPDPGDNNARPQSSLGLTSESTNSILNLLKKDKAKAQDSQKQTVPNNQNDAPTDKKSDISDSDKARIRSMTNQGYTISEIANALNISTSTVEAYKPASTISSNASDNSERKRILNTGSAKDILDNQNKYQYSSIELTEAYNRLTTSQKLSDLINRDSSAGYKHAKQISDTLGPISNGAKQISTFINNGIELYNNVNRVKKIFDTVTGNDKQANPQASSQSSQNSNKSTNKTVTTATRIRDIGEVNIVDMHRQLKELDEKRKKQQGKK